MLDTMKDKGISPLIAAVILIAFVIAIAAVASGFFSGFMKGRVSEVETSGAQTVDCSVANFDIDEDTVDGSGASFTVSVKGETTLKNWTFTVYDTNGTSVSDTANQKLSPGKSHHFTGVNTVNNPYRIRVSTQACPGRSSIVNKTAGTWGLIY